jgi:hypothetical protein
MIVIAAAIAALTLTAAPAPYPKRHTRRRTHVARRSVSARVLRRQQLVLLAIRRQELDDLLVEIGTEAPVLRDARIIDIADVRIGPTSIDDDFLDSPIARTRVENESSTPLDLIVTASFTAASGETARASTVVTRLRPSESRPIELACPSPMLPVRVDWQVERL